QPFPMNPFFKPKSPLSDATRTDIFSKYLSDPSAWTPRALAEKFGLSIVRVQAILRLKALQQQMEKDKVPLQTGLTRGMEAMLGAETLSAADGQKKPRERLRATPAKRLQPFFRMMDEEEAFLPEDAAALMQLEPYANLQRKLDEAADHVFELEPRKGKKPEIISKDENLKSKFQYMIVDTSNVEKAQVVFRDKDGSLRHATVEERFKRKNQKAKFLM
ncbi:eukaryotic mitochondrial regulator protein-domain-containing protein, partial [Fimicolochytrium jonesii]|uniref:eukaryotic mitochondrial regulator protein-domain-containing protein n=1 Tax=Fimicolochytrium jonesii TaxID=1396493 RepID=UPI0022FDEBC4